MLDVAEREAKQSPEREELCFCPVFAVIAPCRMHHCSRQLANTVPTAAPAAAAFFANGLNVLASRCSKKRLEGDRASAILLMGCRMAHGVGKAMTPNDAEAIIAFLVYCLAVHATQQERRKLR